MVSGWTTRANPIRLGHSRVSRPTPPAVAPMQPQTARCTSQGNIELMSKKQVFDFKLAPRPEQISGKRREQTEDRKHHVE
jgi:hypothetical protein